MNIKHLLRRLALPLIMLLTAIPSVSAQSYRGFVDLNCYYEFLKVPHYDSPWTSSIYNTKSASGLAAGLATVHGIQWRQFFLGAGIEAVISPNVSDLYVRAEPQSALPGGPDFDSYYYEDGKFTDLCSLPLFACLRYDMFGSGKTSFYAEGRIGSSIAFQKGFYGALTIGMRRRFNRTRGFNFGLSLRTRHMELYSMCNPKDDYYINDNSVLAFFKQDVLGIGFQFAFDF